MASDQRVERGHPLVVADRVGRPRRGRDRPRPAPARPARRRPRPRTRAGRRRRGGRPGPSRSRVARSRRSPAGPDRRVVAAGGGQRRHRAGPRRRAARRRRAAALRCSASWATRSCSLALHLTRQLRSTPTRPRAAVRPRRPGRWRRAVARHEGGLQRVDGVVARGGLGGGEVALEVGEPALGGPASAPRPPLSRSRRPPRRRRSPAEVPWPAGAGCSVPPQTGQGASSTRVAASSPAMPSRRVGAQVQQAVARRLVAVDSSRSSSRAGPSRPTRASRLSPAASRDRCLVACADRLGELRVGPAGGLAGGLDRGPPVVDGREPAGGLGRLGGQLDRGALQGVGARRRAGPPRPPARRGRPAWPTPRWLPGRSTGRRRASRRRCRWRRAPGAAAACTVITSARAVSSSVCSRAASASTGSSGATARAASSSDAAASRAGCVGDQGLGAGLEGDPSAAQVGDPVVVGHGLHGRLGRGTRLPWRRCRPPPRRPATARAGRPPSRRRRRRPGSRPGRRVGPRRLPRPPGRAAGGSGRRARTGRAAAAWRRATSQASTSAKRRVSKSVSSSDRRRSASARRNSANCPCGSSTTWQNCCRVRPSSPPSSRPASSSRVVWVIQPPPTSSSTRTRDCSGVVPVPRRFGPVPGGGAGDAQPPAAQRHLEHDLRGDALRQRGRSAGTPGRPRAHARRAPGRRARSTRRRGRWSCRHRSAR